MADNQLYWKTSDGVTFLVEEHARGHERNIRVLETIKGWTPPEFRARALAEYIVKGALPIVKALRLTDGWPKEFNADGTERFYEFLPHFRNGDFTMQKVYKGGTINPAERAMLFLRQPQPDLKPRNKNDAGKPPEKDRKT